METYFLRYLCVLSSVMIGGNAWAQSGLAGRGKTSGIVHSAPVTLPSVPKDMRPPGGQPRGQPSNAAAPRGGYGGALFSWYGWPMPYQPAAGYQAALELYVQPADSSVMIDGVVVGNMWAAGQLLNMEPGSHSIDIYRPGFRSKNLHVTISAGETFPVRVDLIAFGDAIPTEVPPMPMAEPAAARMGAPASPGALVPRGADSVAPVADEGGAGVLKLTVAKGGKLFVDGEAMGDVRAGQARSVDLSAGEHTVRLVRPSGRVEITTIRVFKGETTVRTFE